MEHQDQFDSNIGEGGLQKDTAGISNSKGGASLSNVLIILNILALFGYISSMYINSQNSKVNKKIEIISKMVSDYEPEMWNKIKLVSLFNAELENGDVISEETFKDHVEFWEKTKRYLEGNKYLLCGSILDKSNNRPVRERYKIEIGQKFTYTNRNGRFFLFLNEPIQKGYLDIYNNDERVSTERIVTKPIPDFTDILLIEVPIKL